jgi:hypothetical protein
MVGAADPLLPQSRFSRPDLTRTLAQSTPLHDDNIKIEKRVVNFGNEFN